MTTEEMMAEICRKYNKSPSFFVMHALGLFVWSKMIDIMNSVRDNKYTAVRACHGSSKTFTAACIVVWFLNTFPESKVITTAPVGDQVRLLLWTEINKIYRISRIELDGECQTVMIKTKKEEHYAYGFSTDKPTRAEGWHAPAILFVLDEAKGIHQWMWDSLKGAMSGKNARLLAISTTDGTAAGEKFFEIFKGRYGARFNKIHIDVFDLPAFTGEKLKSIEWTEPTAGLTFKPIEKTVEEMNIQLSDKEWEADCKETWGGDSVLYLTKCRGEICDETPDSIIKLSQVMKMFDNWDDPKFDDSGAVRVGADIARKGNDSTSFYMSKGLKSIKHTVYNKRRVDQVADHLVNFVDGNKNILIKIDDTGLGGGVTDLMVRWQYEGIVPVNFNQKAMDEDKYPNAISEMWFTLADKIETMACEPNEQLKAELVNRKALKLDNKGRRQVEPKDVYKKRMGGKSPDDADAFLLTNYEISNVIEGEVKGFSEKLVSEQVPW